MVNPDELTFGTEPGKVVFLLVLLVVVVAFKMVELVVGVGSSGNPVGSVTSVVCEVRDTTTSEAVEFETWVERTDGRIVLFPKTAAVCETLIVAVCISIIGLVSVTVFVGTSVASAETTSKARRSLNCIFDSTIK